jgi:hypothetical protein
MSSLVGFVLHYYQPVGGGGRGELASQAASLCPALPLVGKSNLMYFPNFGKQVLTAKKPFLFMYSWKN